MKQASVSPLMLGARLERARLSTRNFKSLPNAKTRNGLANLHSASTVNSGQQASTKDASLATYLATWSVSPVSLNPEIEEAL